MLLTSFAKICYTISVMIEIGSIIARIRKSRGIGQNELAVRADMSPTQLCLVEKDRVSPTIRTVERIADALGISFSELLGGGTATDTNDPAPRVVALPGDFIALRRNEPAAAKALSAILKEEEILANIESERGIPSVCSIFGKPTRASLDGKGVAMAAEVRKMLGVGSAPLGDLAACLDFKGVRIYKIPLSYQAQSVSLWNKSRNTFSIVLDEGNTPERDLYRLAHEIGCACIFVAGDLNPLDETHAQHRFLSDFAPEFLMPSITVRQFVAETGISRTGWTLHAICAIKARFGVSAEAFSLRLEELGLIDPDTRIKIRDDLRKHYASHPECMEPTPCLPPLDIAPRRRLLAPKIFASQESTQV